jgi:hypothetical protein
MFDKFIYCGYKRQTNLFFDHAEKLNVKSARFDWEASSCKKL